MKRKKNSTGYFIRLPKDVRALLKGEENDIYKFPSEKLIFEHSSRRVDSFFYQLILYYNSGKKLEIKPTKLQDRRKSSPGSNYTAGCHSALLPSLSDESLEKTHFYVNLNSTIELPHVVNHVDCDIEYIMRPIALSILNQVSAGQLTPLLGMQQFFIEMDNCLSTIEENYRKDNKYEIKLIVLSLQRKGTFDIQWNFKAQKINNRYILSILCLRREKFEVLESQFSKNNCSCQAEYDHKENYLFNRKYEEIKQTILGSISSGESGNNVGYNLCNQKEGTVTTRAEFKRLTQEYLEENKKGFEQLTGLTKEEFKILANSYKSNVQSMWFSNKENLLATIIYRRFYITDEVDIAKFFIGDIFQKKRYGKSFKHYNDEAFLLLINNYDIDSDLKSKLICSTYTKKLKSWDNLNNIVDYCADHYSRSESLDILSSENRNDLSPYHSNAGLPIIKDCMVNPHGFFNKRVSSSSGGMLSEDVFYDVSKAIVDSSSIL